MSYEISEIEGIGDKYSAKLAEAGIENTDDLLEKCGAKKGRVATAEATGISEKLILTWANMADLMRIKGVGRQYAELMHAAGVDTIKELRHRNAENLATKIEEVNAEKNLAKATPAAKMVQGWIDSAKEMEPAITH